jgi:hypothetical protein
MQQTSYSDWQRLGPLSVTSSGSGSSGGGGGSSTSRLSSNKYVAVHGV